MSLAQDSLLLPVIALSICLQLGLDLFKYSQNIAIQDSVTGLLMPSMLTSNAAASAHQSGATMSTPY